MKIDDQLSLIACILHLKRASLHISSFDNELSLLLLDLSKGILDRYNIDKKDVEELENIEQEIVKDD